MQYNGKWDWQQSYNLPVGLRNWYALQLTNQLEEEQKAIEESRKKKK